MDFENPDFLFVLVDGRLVPRLFPFFYRRYAETIELKGDEAVLDFGAGSGGLAPHLSPRLNNDGKIHLREPTKASDGMGPDEVRALMNRVGLSEGQSSEGKRFPLGPIVSAVLLEEG